MKNGEPLKRYEIVAGNYSWKMSPSLSGEWVKYNDVMEQRNEMYTLKLKIDLLEAKIKELGEYYVSVQELQSEYYK